MPLTTYTAGEVLTASSLNDNFTFAASNPPGGLALISTTTIGTAVASVTVSGAFSATYENYFVSISGGVSSTACNLQLQLGAQTTGYFGAAVNIAYSGGAVTGTGDNNTSSMTRVGWAKTDAMQAFIFIGSPNLSKVTSVAANLRLAATTASNYMGGDFATTQHTAFTILASAGTLTGGEIRVYGYANS
jgi:hypothetical protein